jgi:hypothetical protein
VAQISKNLASSNSQEVNGIGGTGFQVYQHESVGLWVYPQLPIIIIFTTHVKRVECIKLREAKGKYETPPACMQGEMKCIQVDNDPISIVWSSNQLVRWSVDPDYKSHLTPFILVQHIT